ncbi:hypothetical protein [Neptunomonas concharum]|uniref:Uncharacterized protein n=1 Tax=Neptunomonas concharum TaxID=1031538 RepID=A0A5P1RBV3_9GAMM|nr:hypothetical protein [Neptunomonas concharum]QEQ96755.1 hypothetical protein F0U83_08510 [Neptunomonas concharum]
MWFLFGIISLVVYSAYKIYKNLDVAWEGEYRFYKNIDYKIAYSNVLLIGIDSKNGYDYRLKREVWFDRLCKYLGLIVEFQVGDRKFDDLVFIMSDNEQLHRQLAEKEKIIPLVLDIYSAVNQYTFYVKEIRHNSGLLWIKFTTYSVFDEHDIQALVPKVVPLLNKLSNEIESIPDKKDASWTDPFTYKAAALLGISSALGIFGYYQFERLVAFDSSVLIDEATLFYDALLLGSLLLAMLIGSVLLLLRRSSRRHLVLLEALLIGGFGCFATSFFELKDYNADFDTAEPKIFEVSVFDKRSSSSRRRATSYYLYTEDWLNEGTQRSIRVDSSIYVGASSGDKVYVSQKSGALGYRWIESVELKH